ncbi:MAG: ribose 5-phosphate isomerase B [Termitinemataceae bacterium]|nr:MAG: ribose 5-phosphate isomerase B [Termitinemataceae bacterium]
MIAIASDHGGYALKLSIISFLDALHVPYKDFGCKNAESCDYVDFCVPAARSVARGECEKGIVICGTGAGMSYTANKIKGIRCVLCSEPFTAKLSREHNNANMLALGGRVVGDELAKMIVQTWLNTEFSNEDRHRRRIEKISALE